MSVLAQIIATQVLEVTVRRTLDHASNHIHREGYWAASRASLTAGNSGVTQQACLKRRNKKQRKLILGFSENAGARTKLRKRGDGLRSERRHRDCSCFTRVFPAQPHVTDQGPNARRRQGRSTCNDLGNERSNPASCIDTVADLSATWICLVALE